MLLIALSLAAGTATCASLQTQVAMTQCASADYRRADALMTGQWKISYAFMKRRDAQDTSRGGGFGYAAALLESQRAWLRFRDTQCVVEGGRFAGASAQPMAQTQCKVRLTRERTNQLKSLVWSR